MRLTIRLFLLISSLFSLTALACPPSQKNCIMTLCCGAMGGIRYCDASAGRFVCNNGYYSSCYCDRHAVMSLQHIQGCCTWQGGVFKIDPRTGLVICNSGAVSEVCSPLTPTEPVASF